MTAAFESTRTRLIEAIPHAESKTLALQTAEFFKQRAGNALSEDLMRFLANVKNRPPVDGDELIS